MSARPTKWRVAEVVVGRRPAQRGVFDTLEEAQAFVDEMRIFWLGDWTGGRECKSRSYGRTPEAAVALGFYELLEVAG